MAKVDFAANRQKAEAEGLVTGGGGAFYKLKEGDNRIRLLSECVPHQNEYQGKKTFKWLCYVLDRRTGKVCPFFMAHTIYKAIESLQRDADYEFFDMPMPYDINIHAKGAGTIDVEYQVLPARKSVPLTSEEEKEYAAVKPLEELKQAIKDKQAKTAKPERQPGDEDEADFDQRHTAPVDLEDVPFARTR